MALVNLKIRGERKAGARLVQLQIAKTQLTLVNDALDVRAKAGKEYWLYLVIEGKAGASMQLRILTEDDRELLKITHEETRIPSELGRNGGSFSFQTP